MRPLGSSFLHILFLGLFLLSSPIKASTLSPETLYRSLDPCSLKQHLAYLHLHRDTPSAERAIHHLYSLLPKQAATIAPETWIHAAPKLVQALSPHPWDEEMLLRESETRNAVRKAAESMGSNRRAGHLARNEEEMLSLPEEEWDLARAIILAEQGWSPNGVSHLETIEIVEAELDLWALQIRANLRGEECPQGALLVETINHLLFEELQFRFPPESTYTPLIDRYTNLSTVISSRRGVCLGIAILYLALAQRVDLPLEIITPPGHIFLRYVDPLSKRGINIETTAYGSHLPDEQYLAVDLLSLPKRRLKEVVGMVHFNAASVFLQQGNYAEALSCYKKAERYLEKDSLLEELKGYCYLMCDEHTLGFCSLQSAMNHPIPHNLAKRLLLEDVVGGSADKRLLKTLLIHKKNRKREQLEGERKNLAELQELYPTSQALLLERAFLEKELRNGNEGCRLLGLFCQKNQEELSSHYLLSLWQLSRGDYEKSWTTWHQLEKVCGERHPPCLEELRLELLRHSADPSPSKLLTPNPHDEPHIHETR